MDGPDRGAHAGRSPDISRRSRRSDALLSWDGPARTMGPVSSTAQQPAGVRRADVSMTAYLSSDLERFWPSRRGHAFDEFCR